MVAIRGGSSRARSLAPRKVAESHAEKVAELSQYARRARAAYALETRLFPAFVAVAELQSFTLAARALHMTQSGVSQHVAKLEQQLGRTLFVRLGRMVTLTVAGELLLDYIRLQLDGLDVLHETLRSEQAVETGSICIAAVPTSLCSERFAAVLALASRERQLQLKIRTACSDEVMAALHNHEADLGLLVGDHEDAQLIMHPAWTQDCVLVTARDSGVDVRDSLTLTAAPRIDYPSSEIYWKRWFWKAEQFSSVAAVADTIAMALQMVAAGLGISVMPRSCAAEANASGSVLVHAHPVAPISCPVVVACRVDAPMTLHTRGVLAELSDVTSV